MRLTRETPRFIINVSLLYLHHRIYTYNVTAAVLDVERRRHAAENILVELSQNVTSNPEDDKARVSLVLRLNGMKTLRDLV